MTTKLSRFPQQVIPLAILFGLAIVGLILIRHFLVPDTFGEYGHYRAKAVDEIAALPVIPMLGTEGRLVSIKGQFTGMDGATQADAMLLGAVCLVSSQSVFVKMVGPAADVKGEQARFEAFCRSLH